MRRILAAIAALALALVLAVPAYADLAVDVTDSHAMHELGLPTKADVIQYHVYGRWGWHTVGDSHVFTVLPGGTEVWDKLYGIEPNTAFKC